MGDLSTHVGSVLIGVLAIVIGCSFAYKFFLASIFGRISYWTGFLPFTLMSPFLTHLPAGKRTLVRRAEGLWVHLLMAPIYLICSVLCLAAGADMIGLPGTNTVNYVLNGGDISKPTSVSFDKTHGRYAFPLLTRASTKFGKIIEHMQVPENEKDKLLHDNNTSYNNAKPSD